MHNTSIMICTCTARDIHAEAMSGCKRCGQFNWGMDCGDPICDLRAEAMGDPELEAQLEADWRVEVLGHVYPDADHESVQMMLGEAHVLFMDPADVERVQETRKVAS